MIRHYSYFSGIILLLICGSLQAQDRDTIPDQKLQEIEISVRNKPTPNISTSPLQVISNEELLEQGIQSVADAVRRFNGVVLKDYGGIGGLKTISVRGMGAEHTTISYDGVMVSNMQSGQVDLGRFSLDNISMVSLNIGQSDDIFQTAKSFSSSGTLNLQTIIPEFTGKNYRGHARITGGSFGLFNPMLDYANKLNNTFTLSANGSWQRADGAYTFKDYVHGEKKKRKNSDVDIYRTELNLYSDFGKSGTLNAKLYYFDSERGLPGSVIIGNDYAAERLWDRNFFSQLAYNNTFNEKLRFKSQFKYDNVYTKYKDIQANGTEIYIYKEQEVYLSNALNYLINDKISITLSEDLFFNKLKREYEILSKPVEGLPSPERYNSLIALAFQFKNNYITITSSLLATYISEKAKDKKENTYKRLSPSAGISYKPFQSVNMRIRGSYKHAYRIPTFTELYYTNMTAEKILKPESAHQFNLGANWVGGIADSFVDFLSFSIDGYYNEIDDKIVIIPGTFTSTTVNMGKVDMKGVDVRMASNFAINNNMAINLTAVYSYMDARNMTDKNAENYKDQLPYTPRHSGSATLSFSNPWVNVSYTVFAASERYKLFVNTPDNKMDGYTDHSISLFRSFRLKGNEIYIQGNLQNIWNQGYDIIAFYPMPGRSFKVSAGIKF